MITTKKTSHWKILRFMQLEPQKEWWVKDFMKFNNFIWYKAGTRLWELVKEGYVKSENVEGSRFHAYTITQKGMDFKFKDIEVTTVWGGKVEAQFLGTTNIPNPEYVQPVKGELSFFQRFMQLLSLN